MKASPADIVRAGLAVIADALRKHGHVNEAEHLPKLLREMAGERTLRAVLTTPSGDAGPFRTHIEEALRQKFGDIELVEQADPSIIGGAVLTVGDDRIDFSVRGALDEVQESIRTANVSSVSHS